MKKDEVIQTLAARTGFSKDQITKTVDELLDLIGDTLDNNGFVDLGGFGVFDVELAPTVSGTNPHTGQPQLSKPRRRPRFKAGAELSGKVN